MSTKDAKFSSRVLNMKFMRRADEAKEKNEEELESKKLKDQSEWKLPSVSKELKAKLINRPKIRRVGYASLMSVDDEQAGRKKYGEPAEATIEDEAEISLKKQTKSQKESQDFMQKLGMRQREEDDNILDSLTNGISGAGSTARKRASNDDFSGKSKSKKAKH